MDNTKIRQLLKRYLEGKNSSQEKETIEHWYQALEEDGSILPDAKKELLAKQQIWNAIKPALVAKPVQCKLFPNWPVAAAIALVAGALVLLFWNNDHKNAQLHVHKNLFTTISTHAGERKSVTLPDGSKLLLNSGSTIQVPDNFSAKRNIYLTDGEVFFDVKHDPKRPFIIKSGPLTTQVLGTAFNIRAYREMKKMTVGVTRGKVGVTSTGQQTRFLTNGEQMSYHRENKRISLTALDTQELAWQKGILVLNDASFEEMCILMDKNFGIKIFSSEESLRSKHFTATISTALPALKAAQVVAAIHQLKTKKGRDGIEIYH